MAGTRVFPVPFIGEYTAGVFRPIAKKGDPMKILTAAFAMSSVLALGGTVTVASAQPTGRTYVACNQFGECWRVHQRYAYGEAAPITYYNADYYDSHRSDEK